MNRLNPDHPSWNCEKGRMRRRGVQSENRCRWMGSGDTPSAPLSLSLSLCFPLLLSLSLCFPLLLSLSLCFPLLLPLTSSLSPPRPLLPPYLSFAMLCTHTLFCYLSLSCSLSLLCFLPSYHSHVVIAYCVKTLLFGMY